jgi:general secretion pathway protein J
MINTNNKHSGFTLIELMVAIMIFAIITVISYRTLSALIATKDGVETAQAKWGGISKTMNQMSVYCNRIIPLTVLDVDGSMMPAVLGKSKLTGNFDSQLEMTTSGFIGDLAYGSTPPKRIGFRYANGKLFLVIWPVLNRAPNTKPDLILLSNQIASFKIKYLYQDRQWYDTWPLNLSSYAITPLAIKMYIKMNSGEEIDRQWALQ